MSTTLSRQCRLAANTSFKAANQAFNDAVASGRLNAVHGFPNSASDYMYMGTYGGKDQFKHIDTREYLA